MLSLSRHREISPELQQQPSNPRHPRTRPVHVYVPYPHTLRHNGLRVESRWYHVRHAPSATTLTAANRPAGRLDCTRLTNDWM